MQRYGRALAQGRRRTRKALSFRGGEGERAALRRARVRYRHTRRLSLAKISSTRRQFRRALREAALVLARLWERFEKPMARLLGRSPTRRSEAAHKPLGRRGRQTALRVDRQGNIRVGGSTVRAQSVLPSEIHSDAPAPQTNLHPSDSRQGFIDDGVRAAHNANHFDQANARAIHGSRSSQSRGKQGRRDHRRARAQARQEELHGPHSDERH